MTEHPVRCWLLPGHGKCAVQAAATLAEQRAEWLRDNTQSPTAVAIAVALKQLDVKPVPRKRGRPPSVTAEQAREIRDLYGANGGIIGLVSMRQLATHFRVSYSTVFNVIHSSEEAA